MGPLLKIVEQIIKSFMEINFKNKFSNSIKKKTGCYIYRL